MFDMEIEDLQFLAVIKICRIDQNSKLVTPFIGGLTLKRFSLL